MGAAGRKHERSAAAGKAATEPRRAGGKRARRGETTLREVAFDKILAKRQRSGRTEYLVKFVGDEDSSWDPTSHIHEPSAVASFERGPEQARRETAT